MNGVCRGCGCTDDDCSGCIERTGHPCHWVAPGFCSACAQAELPKVQAQMVKVRAMRSEEHEQMKQFLAFAQAEPYPETAEGWRARQAEARRRWPSVAELFDGWGVDIGKTIDRGSE